VAVLVVSLARADKDARLRFVNYGPDTARLNDGPPTTREVKDRFFHDVPAAARATGAATATAAVKEEQGRQGRAGERKGDAPFERNSLSWLRAVRMYVRFHGRGASRALSR